MNYKTIYIGNNPTLSEAVQRLLFSKGYGWLIDGNNVRETEYPYLLAHANKVIKWGAGDYAHDFDANTEFGKIIEWLERPEETIESLKARIKEIDEQHEREVMGLRQLLESSDTENQRLQRENQQLLDDLRAAEEKGKIQSFPEGYDWSNPNNLTPEQVGVEFGWRPLVTSEVGVDRPYTNEIERWCGDGWNDTEWAGSDLDATYRVKWPLPPLDGPTKAPEPPAIPTQQDEFPGSIERLLEEKKRIGLDYMLGVFKAAKEVWAKGTENYAFTYGEAHRVTEFGLSIDPEVIGDLSHDGKSFTIDLHNGTTETVTLTEVMFF